MAAEAQDKAEFKRVLESLGPIHRVPRTPSLRMLKPLLNFAVEEEWI
jgi:hypothetical protein